MNRQFCSRSAIREFGVVGVAATGGLTDSRTFETDYIVSGDEHLQRLGEFRGASIVTPARTLAILRV